MRVALATGIFPPDIGGPATHASDLRETLAERGHRVTVLTLSDGSPARETEELMRWPRWWPWPARVAAIARWLAEHRDEFDVVYATGLHVEAALGGRLASRPVVLKVVGDPAWERGRRLGLTDAEFEEFLGAGSTSSRIRAMAALRDATLRSADAVVTPSHYLADVVERWLGGPAGVEVIPNGVRIPDGIERRDPGARGELNVVYAGRLVSHKRVERLIEAVSVTEGVRLRIVGTGPEEARLRARAAPLADRVQLAGDLPHPDVIRAMWDADVLALASGYEGLPHVVIEALACGTPVLSPPVGGVGEVVRDGESGLLVPPDVESLAGGMTRLRDDPALLRKISEGARAEGERWRIDATADRLVELFERVQRPTPRAVFLGKTRLDPEQPALRRKVSTLQRHVEPVLVGIGPRRFTGMGRTRAIALPEVRPTALGGLLFYWLGPAVAVAAATARRPSAVVCQSPYEGLATELFARLLPLRLRPRVVVEVHGDWRTAPRLYGSRSRGLVAPLSDRLAALALRGADRIRVVSDFTDALARQVAPGSEIDRFVAFTDVSSFLDQPVRSVPERPQAVFVGALERGKAVDVLLSCWPIVLHAVPDARLMIAGDGSLRDELRRRIEALGRASGVEMLGRVGPDRVSELLDGSRCLVLPSRSEGLGRVVIEAFARGRPVVASRAGGIGELVTNGDTGILVEPDDPPALAEALVRLFRDRELAARLGDRAHGVLDGWDPEGEFEGGIARLAASILEE